jgi:ElaB/YqjD/DUF883 family membrane-anchored ribosome-binding protein
MSDATEADIEALIAEMKNLRADFSRIGEILKDTARHGSQDAKETVRGTAEKGWSEAKSKAQNLFEEMEHRPMQSALTIFGVGILLGLLVGRR